MKIRNFILILLLSLGCLVAYSQEEPARLNVTFSVFPLDGDDWNHIYYAPDGVPASKLVELQFNRLERSREYVFSGSAPLQFYRMNQNPDGTRGLSVLGSAPIPAGNPVHPQILFFLPPEEDSTQLRVLRIEDSEETFPKESLVVINTLMIPLRGVLGQEALEIPPGPSRPVSVKQYFGNQVPIVFAINHNNELHMVLNNKISFFPDRRDLLILRKPRISTSLRIRTQRVTEYMGARVGDFDVPAEETGGE